MRDNETEDVRLRKLAYFAAVKVQLVLALVVSSMYTLRASEPAFWRTGGVFTHPSWMPTGLGSVVGSELGQQVRPWLYTALLVAMWALYALAVRTVRSAYPAPTR